VQRVFFGPLTRPENAQLKDMGRREIFVTAPFVVLVLVMGLKPQPILDILSPSTDRFIARALYAVAPDATAEAAVKVSVMPLPPKGAVEALPLPQPAAAVQLSPEAGNLAARIQQMRPGVLVPSNKPLPFAMPAAGSNP
jgi:NADH-quinone oxidoreductase subunit M